MFDTIAAHDTKHPALLPWAMRANAAFSALSGATFLLAPRWLSRATGIEPAIAFTVIGAGLLGYAIWLWFNSRGKVVSRSVALTAIVADSLWVVASIVVLVGGLLPLTTAGKWGVAIVADIVGILAILQFLGLRRRESA